MRRRWWLAVAVTLAACAVIFAQSGDAKNWTRTYVGDRATPFTGKVLTSQFHDSYRLSSSSGGITATAPQSNRGGNLREVFWPRQSKLVTDSRVCATWTKETSRLEQEGVAFRVVTVPRRTRAITVTKNVFFGVTWVFNVLIWDTASSQPYRGIAQFDMEHILVRHGSVRPFPWRVCSQVVGRTLKFKLWFPNREGEPAWDDPKHARKTTVPAGYRAPGRSGWYVAHIRPGGLIRYTRSGIWSHH